MLKTLAVGNYRSLLNLVVPLGPLNLITGPNGSGKSNLYNALRLLAESAQNGVVNALAREGGLQSTVWAGPENISRRMETGEVPVQGTTRKEAVRLRLGFTAEDFGYSISLGLPTPSISAFGLDPEIKRECIWAGPFYRPASLLVDRNNGVVRTRSGRDWTLVGYSLGEFDSIFSHIADPVGTPEVYWMRERIRSWRFYDHFRTDREAPARSPHLGTRTPVLRHDGGDLAAALQTIREIGDSVGLDAAIRDAFPGGSIADAQLQEGRFSIEFSHDGLQRPLSGTELSDGTLRYLLWVAALLTPRPPSLMILNEPETSLHPDLLPALARLITRASENTQVWVISHAKGLISALKKHRSCNLIELKKDLGRTQIITQKLLNQPAWHWPD